MGTKLKFEKRAEQKIEKEVISTMPANRSDYIILNKKLEKYAHLLEDNLGTKFNVSVSERCRLGFYIYVLETVCDEADVQELTECIIDSSFNKTVFGSTINDFGVDAVHIDKDNFCVKLFNFKYREKFNPNKTQSLNDNFSSTKFLNLAIGGDKKTFKKYPDKFRDKIEKVHEILNDPQEEWDVELYQVSNEAEEVKELDGELELLADQYAIKVIAIALPTLSEYMSIRPDLINSTVILDSQSVMSYSESEVASAKSFIVRMKCSELLRITCNSKDLRERVNIENVEPLRNAYLDFGVLFDNVRGLVKKSKYNENIAKTLKHDPKKFFMYNNGVTLVADSIVSRQLPGKKALKLDIKGFQVVNGGQTLRTIHEFNKIDGENLENYLYDAEVLVRIFMPSEADEAHKIAEYTNSQNAIKPVDLKSLASEQIEIEKYLHEHNIAYARKSGDTGPDQGKDYLYTINMEQFGKLLKAMSGQPEKATNGLKEIFDGKYEELFIESFNLEAAPSLIQKYFRVIRKYKENKVQGNQLKYFYVCYFSTLNKKFDEDAIILLLEKFLSEYREQVDITVVKALSSTAFKRYFESKVKEGSAVVQ